MSPKPVLKEYNIKNSDFSIWKSPLFPLNVKTDQQKIYIKRASSLENMPVAYVKTKDDQLCNICIDGTILLNICGCAAWFLLDLVENHDSFSCDMAQMSRFFLSRDGNLVKTKPDNCKNKP